MCVCVCVCVCLSVKSHLTSKAFVHPENTVTYLAGNGGQKICGVFSETAPLQRSSTHPVERLIPTVGHFPAESAHAHSNSLYLPCGAPGSVISSCVLVQRSFVS